MISTTFTDTVHLANVTISVEQSTNTSDTLSLSFSKFFYITTNISSLPTQILP